MPSAASESSTRNVPTSACTATVGFQNMSEFYCKKIKSLLVPSLDRLGSEKVPYDHYSVQLIFVAIDGNDWRFARKNTAIRESEIANRTGQDNQISFLKGFSSMLPRLYIKSCRNKIQSLYTNKEDNNIPTCKSLLAPRSPLDIPPK